MVDVLSNDGTLFLITPWGTKVDGDLITRLEGERTVGSEREFKVIEDNREGCRHTTIKSADILAEVIGVGKVKASIG